MITAHKKIVYHLKNWLFKEFAIPPVINENISKAYLKKILPDNPVIVDCGSHNGSDSVQLAKLFKKATIHSFEPVPSLLEMLLNNSKPYNSISCYPLALADKSGYMDLYISEGASNASSSLLEPLQHLQDHPDTFFRQKIMVKTNSIDDWAAENNIKKVDMLWLDMQGFELKMLGASKIILDSVSVIHTEVSTKETFKGVAQYKEYRSFLESKGFELLLEAIPKGWDMGNALFLRKKI